MPDPRENNLASTPESNAVAGYLRVSGVNYPPQCQSAGERDHFLQDLRARRVVLLSEAAARRNLSIGRWYEDLGCSGRGEFLAQRTGFEALTQAARAGTVRMIFAFDLSRLFRDLLQQELWLLEMETLGVGVEVPDLPFAVEPAARVLLRQQIGMINEYIASRNGAILSAVLTEKVEQGQWVGRVRSQWGLRYDPTTKGFGRDDATVPLIQHVYETFNAQGGNGYRTAKRLNAEVTAQAPGAVLSPLGGFWDVCNVLYHVRNPLYRRIATFHGTAIPAPHLIPEVIAPEVLAITDGLLAARAAFHATVADWLAVPHPPLPYSRRLVCAECGSLFQAYRHESQAGVSPGPRVSWGCNQAAQGSQRPGQGCQARARLPQYRLQVLLDRGLRQWFHADREAYQAAFPALRRFCPVFPGPITHQHEPLAEYLEPQAEYLRRKAHRARKTQVMHNLRRNRCLRAQLLEEFADGLLSDHAALESRLERLADSTAAFEAEWHRLVEHERDGGWRGTALGRLCSEFENVWPGDWWLPVSSARDQFVQDLGLRVVVRILPRTQPRKTAPRCRSKTGKPYFEQRRFGLCEIAVSSPGLGIPAEAPVVFAETQAELDEYTRLRRLDPDLLAPDVLASDIFASDVADQGLPAEPAPAEV